jgi:hypothetical protein
LDIESLFHEFAQPLHWIFPVEGDPEEPDLCHPELISEANIKALLNDAPWQDPRTLAAPVSFDLSGWFETIAQKYIELEDEHRQSIWESTHVLPISSALRKRDPFFAKFAKDSKQRRSRLGARWKSFLRSIFKGIIAGHCDLDLLLDPLFLQYPRKGEKRAWYPGDGCRRSPSDLLSALKLVDRADPWQNQFRHCIQDHPSSKLDRLASKFMPLETP